MLSPSFKKPTYSERVSLDPVSEKAFCRAIIKQMASGVIRDRGYKATTEGAMETLTEVVEQFLSALGQACHGFADQSGRTQGNAMDVLMALGDLGVDLHAIYNYGEENQQEIFEIAIPKFPLDPIHSVDGTNIVLASLPRRPHPNQIPSHLPPLPPNHTYIHTPIFAEMERDPGILRMRKVQERKLVSTGLASFMVHTNQVPARIVKENVVPLITWPPKPNHLSGVKGQNGVCIDTIGLSRGGSLVHIGGVDDNLPMDDGDEEGGENSHRYDEGYGEGEGEGGMEVDKVDLDGGL